MKINIEKIIDKIKKDETFVKQLTNEELDLLIRDSKSKLRKANAVIGFEERYWDKSHLLTDKALHRDKMKYRLFILNKEKERRDKFGSYN